MWTHNAELELRKRKRIALRTADELGYLLRFPGVRKQIQLAETEVEITKIMATCRQRY